MGPETVERVSHTHTHTHKHIHTHHTHKHTHTETPEERQIVRIPTRFVIVFVPGATFAPAPCLLTLDKHAEEENKSVMSRRFGNRRKQAKLVHAGDAKPRPSLAIVITRQGTPS